MAIGAAAVVVSRCATSSSIRSSHRHEAAGTRALRGAPPVGALGSNVAAHRWRRRNKLESNLPTAVDSDIVGMGHGICSDRQAGKTPDEMASDLHGQLSSKGYSFADITGMVSAAESVYCLGQSISGPKPHPAGAVSGVGVSPRRAHTPDGCAITPR